MMRLWFSLLAWPLAIRIALAVLCFMVWTYFCLSPADDVGGVELINDKLAHAVGNFGLLMSLVLAVPSAPLIALAVLVFGYSLGIEGVQSYLPTRYCSLADVVANGVGVAIAYGLSSVLVKNKQRVSDGVE